MLHREISPASRPEVAVWKVLTAGLNRQAPTAESIHHRCTVKSAPHKKPTLIVVLCYVGGIRFEKNTFQKNSIQSRWGMHAFAYEF